jgi:glycerol kinase
MSESGIFVAAIDQGSSSTKGAVVSVDGRRLAEVSIPVGTVSSGASVTHDPEELALSVERALDDLLARHPVDAIGLTCQRSTCLVWERESGRALTRAVSWQDTSSQGMVEGLAPHSRLIREKTGLRLSPHYAGSKLAALVESVEDGRERARRGEIFAGTLDAFLSHRLTGRAMTEPGHAGRTLLYDLDIHEWSPALAEIFGLPLACLPEVVPSAGHHGECRGIPVTALAGDQQAALIGHGGWEGGITAVHFGTGAFVLTATGERLERRSSTLSAVLASTRERSVHQIEATVNSAGSAVDWAVGLSGEDLGEWRSREIDPDRIPWVLPTFRGAGSPWWQPGARAVAAGMTLESTGADLLGGVVFGVAMRVLDCVELLQGDSPQSVVRASGKLARLSGLTGLVADAGGVAVETASDEEVGLVGIARLAAAGLDGDERWLRQAPPDVSRREPRWSPGRARAVRDRWRSFAARAIELSLDE